MEKPARYFEEIECRLLASYAVKSKYSKGRLHSEPPSSSRTCFQRDRDRIIHSKAFRRLKHKTQVFVSIETDHYRSRLTHTLEVAQISRHLARLLRVNEDLAEGIALAHDLGHTPFGHAGERTLSELMRPYGGFEHNLQSLRVVNELEEIYPGFNGLNLSLELRDGLRKHKTPWDHPDANSPAFRSLEAEICNLSDEIAYNNHDLDDGLRSGLLRESLLETDVFLWKDAKAHVDKSYTNLSERHRKTLINSYLIGEQVEDVFTQTLKNIKDTGIETLEDIQILNTKIVSFSVEMQEKNKQLRQYLFKNFYFHPEVYRMNKKGQKMIQYLFDTFLADPNLLPIRYQEKIKMTESKQRVICDYIAGMTDGFAMREHQSLAR